MNIRKAAKSSKLGHLNRQKPLEGHIKLGSWRQRRDIVTRKIGSLKDTNRHINGKIKNIGQEGGLDEEYESEGNEEDKLMAFNQAFQDAILATMDREISTYEEELIDKTAQVAAISRSKEDLAIALLDEKKEI